MKRTSRSLYYLAGYLLFAGFALLVAPTPSLRLLLSSAEYGDVLPRLLGAVLAVLGILIVQIIRHRIAALYGTTILVRIFLLAVLVALFAYSADPLFLVLFSVVGLGVVLTGTSYLLDRSSAA